MVRLFATLNVEEIYPSVEEFLSVRHLVFVQKTNFFEFFTLTTIRTGKCLRGHEITTLYNLPVKIIFSFSHTELSQ